MNVAPTWECQRSIDVEVPVSFAWAYMTDIRNWNDPPAEFDLEGPFGEGVRGSTRMPGLPLAVWSIRDVEPGDGTASHGSRYGAAGRLLNRSLESPDAPAPVSVTSGELGSTELPKNPVILRVKEVVD